MGISIDTFIIHMDMSIEENMNLSFCKKALFYALYFINVKPNIL